MQSPVQCSSNLGSSINYPPWSCGYTCSGVAPHEGCNFVQELCGLDDWVRLDHLVAKKLSHTCQVQAFGLGWHPNDFEYELGAWGSIDAMDLSKILFVQISTSSTIFGIPCGKIIIDHLVIMGLLYFLLEPKVF